MSKGTFTDYLNAIRSFESGVDFERFKAGIITEQQLKTWTGEENWSAYQKGDMSWNDLQYTSVNSLGFVGYQFGEALLIDLGYYKDDKYYTFNGSAGGQSKNTWDGEFTGKNGINSFDDLKTNLQEFVMRDEIGHNLNIIKNGLEAAGKSLDDILGTTQSYSEANGETTTVTYSLTGLMAAAHLRGPYGVLNLLKNGTVSADETGTSILKYVKLFGGYESKPADAYINSYLEGSKTSNLELKWAWGKHETVEGFDPKTDDIDFKGTFEEKDLNIVERDGSTVIEILSDGKISQSYTLKDIKLSDLSTDDFVSIKGSTDFLSEIVSGNKPATNDGGEAPAVQASNVEIEWGWGKHETIEGFDPKNADLDFNGLFAEKDLNIVERGGSTVIEIKFSGEVQQSYTLKDVKLSDLTVDDFTALKGSTDFLSKIVSAPQAATNNGGEAPTNPTAPTTPTTPAEQVEGSKGEFADYLNAIRSFESGVDQARYKAGIINEQQLRTWTGEENWSAYQKGDMTWTDLQYTSVNSLGFVGYQFGEALLIDLGYYKDDKYYTFDGSAGGQSKNTWDGEFTGKNGINSLADLKTNLQEFVMRDEIGHNLNIIKKGLEAAGKSLDDFLGKTDTFKNGAGETVEVTYSLTGLMAAAHLRGPYGVLNLLKDGTVSADETGTSILKYVKLFGGYDSEPADAYINKYIEGSKTTNLELKWAWGKHETVEGFDPKTDDIDFKGTFAEKDLNIVERDGSTVIEILSDGKVSQSYTLKDIKLSDLSTDDFVSIKGSTDFLSKIVSAPQAATNNGGEAPTNPTAPTTPTTPAEQVEGSKGEFADYLNAIRSFESGVDQARYKAGIINEQQLRTWTGEENWSAYQKGDMTWTDLQYTSVNSLGFVGYQFGEALLIDLGYYKDDKYYTFDGSAGGQSKNTWDGEFTGKNGINSLADLKTNLQEFVMRDEIGHNLNIIKKGLEAAGKSLDDFLGKTDTFKNGAGETVEVTYSLTGLMAAAHLRGPYGVLNLLKDGTVSADETGTSILKYVKLFGGYDSEPADAYINKYIEGSKTTNLELKWAWGKHETVEGFDPKTDDIDFKGTFAEKDLNIVERDGSTVIEILSDGKVSQSYTLKDIKLSDLSTDDFVSIKGSTDFLSKIVSAPEADSPKPEANNFAHQGSLETNVGSHWFRGDLTNLVAGDFDGDGKDDFIRQEKGRWDNDRANMIQFFENDGDGTFSRDGDLKTNVSTNWFKGDLTNLVSGDFNGDGKTDFIRQEKGHWDNDRANMIQYFESNGDGTFTRDGDLKTNVSTNWFKGDLTNLVAGDFNGDGKDDFIRQEKGGWDNDSRNTIQYFESNGDGTFTRDGDLKAGITTDWLKGDVTNLVVGDFDGDGKDDFIRQEKGGWDNDDIGTAQVFLSNGDGSFTKRGELYQKASADIKSFKGDETKLVVGDFNGDGKDDFLEQGADNANLYVATKEGEFKFVDDLKSLMDVNDDRFGSDNASLLIMDVDDDGKDDVVVQNDDAKPAEIYISKIDDPDLI